MKLSYEAETFVASRDSGRPLIRFRGVWYEHEAGRYREVDEESLRAEIRRAMPEAIKRNTVSNVIDEVGAHYLVDRHDDAPMWISEDASEKPDPGNLIVFRNIMLDVTTGATYPHNPDFLTFNSLPYDFDPNAPIPSRWILFLNEVFGNDPEAIRELQKLFGLMMTLDTTQQKLFALIGPKRSGKGTVARVLRALIGEANMAAPSFHGLGGRFGLQTLINKQAAVIADARVGPTTDKILVAERLLTISGEDVVDVERKGTTVWTGKLNARVIILSNELPGLPDVSGALASRFIVFNTPNSFYDREDPHLTGTLLQELSGIASWALEGLRHLRQDGRIVTPASARSLIDDIEKMGSPVKHFVADMCTLDREADVSKDELWATYRGWHVANGLPGHALSKAMFGRTLKTAYPGVVSDYQPKINGERPHYWRGIKPVPNGPLENTKNMESIFPPLGTDWERAGNG